MSFPFNFSSIFGSLPYIFSGGISGFLFALDQLSVASTASYSLRKLRNAYTGSAIRVRRDLDNAEADIGFTGGGELDTTALMAHVGYQNLLTNSEEFTTGVWLNTESNTITANTTASPTGTITADTVTPQAVSTFHRINQNPNVVSGLPYTYSISVKPNGYNFFMFRTTLTGVSRNVGFDLTGSGTVTWVSTGLTATITAQANGFYRLTVSGTASTTGATTFFIRIQPTSTVDDSIAQFTGNGTSGCFLWGACVNQGATATPYQVTTSTIANGDGFITTWYDQSGNARNATQATASNQPQIVSAGAVLLQNGKPCTVIDGVNDVLTATIPSLTAHSINLVTTSTASGANLGLLTYSANTIDQAITHDAGTTMRAYFGGSGNSVSDSVAINTPVVITRTWDGTANIANANLFDQGIAGTTKAGTPTATNATTTLTIGRALGFSQQRLQGLIVFSSALSLVDRQLLELNQGVYYGIPVTAVRGWANPIYLPYAFNKS
jgi:hypothetical protein